jgi:alpha-beta hydrolase superfamily lysophospholipase
MRSHRFARPGHPTLQVALFEPTQPARAAVLVTPGFSEHIGRYIHVANVWAQAGFLVAVYDARGHGDSEGRRAHIDRFTDYTGDVLALLDDLDRLPEWKALGKPILWGHSMGGLIDTLVAIENPERVRALAVSSPFYGQALATPRWKIALGRFVSGFWPTYSDRTNITGVMVTHDVARARAFDADPKRLARVTARWFTELEWAQRRVVELAPRLELPFFGLAAAEDVIADVEVTRRVFERAASKDKELRVLKGQRHELHQEVDHLSHIAAYAERFASWSPAQ